MTRLFFQTFMYFGYLSYKYTMILYTIGGDCGPLCAFYICSDVVFSASKNSQ